MLYFFCLFLAFYLVFHAGFAERVSSNRLSLSIFPSHFLTSTPYFNALNIPIVSMFAYCETEFYVKTKSYATRKSKVKVFFLNWVCESMVFVCCLLMPSCCGIVETLISDVYEFMCIFCSFIFPDQLHRHCITQNLILW